MKFGHHLKNVSQSLPIQLKRGMIPYKLWKRALRKKLKISITSLEQQCDNVDRVLYHANTLQIPKDQIDVFITLNTTAVYKICKKINKKYTVHIFTSWFTKAKQLHYFKFLY